MAKCAICGTECGADGIVSECRNVPPSEYSPSLEYREKQMLNALAKWLMEDERRTAIICRARHEGRQKWYVCLHDFPPKKPFPPDCEQRLRHYANSVFPQDRIVYADSLDDAIQQALHQ